MEKEKYVPMTLHEVEYSHKEIVMLSPIPTSRVVNDLLTHTLQCSFSKKDPEGVLKLIVHI